MNKLNTSIIALAGMLTASISQGQTGSILGFDGQATGTITVTSTNLSGCPTRICTTNGITTNIFCFTNTFEKMVCTTNVAGAVTCSNVLVTEERCFTNIFPEIRCTNEFLAPTTLSLRETLAGALVETPCDQVSVLFPSNAVIQASLLVNVRTNDWAGTQVGFFKILDSTGTNVLAAGSMTGVSGVPCGSCNEFGGILHGTVLASGPLRGASLQAEYAGSLTGVTCPSAGVPQGAVAVTIDGVAVVPCSSGFERLATPVAGQAF